MIFLQARPFLFSNISVFLIGSLKFFVCICLIFSYPVFNEQSIHNHPFSINALKDFLKFLGHFKHLPSIIVSLFILKPFIHPIEPYKPETNS